MPKVVLKLFTGQGTGRTDGQTDGQSCQVMLDVLTGFRF